MATAVADSEDVKMSEPLGELSSIIKNVIHAPTNAEQSYWVNQLLEKTRPWMRQKTIHVVRKHYSELLFKTPDEVGSLMGLAFTKLIHYICLPDRLKNSPDQLNSNDFRNLFAKTASFAVFEQRHQDRKWSLNYPGDEFLKQLICPTSPPEDAVDFHDFLLAKLLKELDAVHQQIVLMRLDEKNWTQIGKELKEKHPGIKVNYAVMEVRRKKIRRTLRQVAERF